MTCRELIDFLADYLEGELAESVRAEFERHLSACKSCRDYLATYRGTVAIANAMGADVDCDKLNVPEDLIQAVMAARRRMV